MKRVKLGKKSLVVMTEEEYQATRDLLYDMAVRIYSDRIDERAWFSLKEVQDVLGQNYIERQTSNTNSIIERWTAFIEKYPRK
mgnify:CR=1 FL=1